MVDIVPIIDRGLGNSSYLVDLGDGRGPDDFVTTATPGTRAHR